MLLFDKQGTEHNLIGRITGMKNEIAGSFNIFYLQGRHESEVNMTFGNYLKFHVFNEGQSENLKDQLTVVFELCKVTERTCHMPIKGFGFD